jgi:hypothetical protein
VVALVVYSRFFVSRLPTGLLVNLDHNCFRQAYRISYRGHSCWHPRSALYSFRAAKILAAIKITRLRPSSIRASYHLSPYIRHAHLVRKDGQSRAVSLEGKAGLVCFSSGFRGPAFRGEGHIIRGRSSESSVDTVHRHQPMTAQSKAKAC